ncbi:nodulation protein NodZ [Calothrix sp. PCC 6303]|uniref:nodulation protein NodZ n=1 Tax=Calothrix sp. PCC 6303 TaxID=1170562 RepID=UPI0002A018B7|nr:nodulation protein NodZ [Calothrix sp. PCC 6303]AFY99518.1 hypothetical protein Cal6303_0441 [Calothrix sp. PCC 6303]
MTTSNKFVVCKGSSGMGNRILAACTAVLYSQITGRNLIIDWRDGSYSEEGLNSFFSFFDYPDGAQIEELIKPGSVYPSMWSNNLNKSFGSLKQELGISDESISFDVSKADYKEDILVFCSYTHKIHQMRTLFNGEFEHLKSLDYRAIIQLILNSNFSLKDDIYRSIETFKSTNFGSKTVGVHVRYTDIKIPLDKLIQATKKVIHKNHSDCVFLSTDAQEVIQIFKQEFDRVVITPKWFPQPGERMHQNWNSCPDRIKNGVEALTDLYLLADCDDLVFSSESSFGYVASILSKAKKDHLHDVKIVSLVDKFKAKARTLISQN